MDEDYRAAVRQGILNYILLDKEEQARLGVPLPKKVSLIYFKFVVQF